ncbi:MAG: hypothetical protein J1F64_06115 [Oscillospiraceae bacterium]|nr:hypothetical protein [Oscillospiraceae bacterium]
MTDSEMLQAIFGEIKKTNQRLDDFNQRLDNLEQDNKTIKQELDALKKEVKQNTAAIEVTVSQCLKAYSDGYIANREKINSLNIDSVNDKINYINLRQQYFEDELERLKIKIS